MNTHPTNIQGVENVVPDDSVDATGWTLNLLNPQLPSRYFPTGISHVNWSLVRVGALQGLHYSLGHTLLWVTRGMAQIVVLDLNKTSPSYTSHFSIDLHEDVMLGVYAPPKTAIGILGIGPTTQVLTLTDDHNSIAPINPRDSRLKIDWGIPPDAIPLKRDEAEMDVASWISKYL